MSFSIDAVAEFEDFVEDMYDFADEQALSVDTQSTKVRSR